jgi:hypothetical protein
VVIMTTASTHSVGRVAQTRNPYSRVRLIQMKWNGIVSQFENTRMAARFTTENSAQATSTQATRQGQLKLPRARDRPAFTGAASWSAASTGAAPKGVAISGAVSSGAAAGAGSEPMALLLGACCRNRSRAPSLTPVALGCRSHPASPSLRGELISLTTHRLDQVEPEF